MPRPLRRLLLAVAMVVAPALGTLSVAADSIRFDLHVLGESVYEAHRRTGSWPVNAADLQGTRYLEMPYRKGFLERGQFVLIANPELAADPRLNGQAILAYDNTSLLSRFGRVWVCRGDLRVEWIPARELRRLVEHAGPQTRSQGS